MKFFKVGGLKVAVIGITNEEAPSVVLPGSFGTIEVTDGIAAANKYARACPEGPGGRGPRDHAQGHSQLGRRSAVR